MAHDLGNKLKVLRNIDVDESGDAGVASPCQLFCIIAVNATAATNEFLKLYDTAGAPTVGTDTPVLTIPLKPALEPTVIPISKGLNFTLGIGLGATTAVADSDTGAPAANAVVVNLLYK